MKKGRKTYPVRKREKKEEKGYPGEWNHPRVKKKGKKGKPNELKETSHKIFAEEKKKKKSF